MKCPYCGNTIEDTSVRCMFCGMTPQREEPKAESEAQKNDYMEEAPEDASLPNEEIPAQELNAPERNGFTVVEWGGSMVG